MPPAKSSRAKPSTSRRLLSAKSTTRRIIYCSVVHLLLHRVLQRQGIGDHLIARFDAGDNLLHVAGKHVSRDHFQALEMARALRIGV